MELPRVPSDTSLAAERRVIDGLSRMTPEARLERTRELCRAASELAIAGIRLRDGELSDEEIRVRLGRLRYEPALMARVEAYLAERRLKGR